MIVHWLDQLTKTKNTLKAPITAQDKLVEPRSSFSSANQSQRDYKKKTPKLHLGLKLLLDLGNAHLVECKWHLYDNNAAG